MEYLSQEIPDVILIQPKVFQDEHGFFLESYQEAGYSSACISK
jgi:dTDP-4-dehydrorhamnose 3,5-epimerase